MRCSRTVTSGPAAGWPRAASEAGILAVEPEQPPVLVDPEQECSPRRMCGDEDGVGMTEPNEAKAATETAVRLITMEPILAVQDVSAAASYYRDVPDFADGWQWGEPPVRGGATRDRLALQCPRKP